MALNEWAVVDEQINRSRIKRFKWKQFLGKSLTEYILRLKMKGFESNQALSILQNHPKIKEFCEKHPEHKEKLMEKLKISVSARFAENNSALNTFRKTKGTKSQKQIELDRIWYYLKEANSLEEFKLWFKKEYGMD